MKKRIVFIPLLLILCVSTAQAGGSVTLVNHTESRLTANAYDWDDSMCQNPASYAALEIGESVNFTCRKSWFDADAPGCKIYIEHTGTGGVGPDDDRWGYECSDRRVDNGTYRIFQLNPIKFTPQ
jgi:hypothetical protein